MARKKLTDLAWCAGFFEGEGCFTIHSRHQPYQTVRATLSQKGTDGKKLLDRFHKIVEVGSVYAYGVNAKNSDMWTWSTHRIGDARKVYELIEPWLGDRRKKRFKELDKEEKKSRKAKAKGRKPGPKVLK